MPPTENMNIVASAIFNLRNAGLNEEADAVRDMQTALNDIVLQAKRVFDHGVADVDVVQHTIHKADALLRKLNRK